MKSGQKVNFFEVCERTTKEPDFSKMLQDKARAAARDGVNSPAWRELESYFFADDAEELAALTAPLEKTVDGEVDPRTLKTLLLMTLHGGVTGTTTVIALTTTTSLLCMMPDIGSEPSRPAPEGDTAERAKKTGRQTPAKRPSARTAKKKRG